MFNPVKRAYYLIGIQITSFLLLLLYCLGAGDGLLLVLPLIMLEAAVLSQVQKGMKKVLMLWQLQFFLAALFGLAFTPSSFLNTLVVRSSVQVFLISVVLVVEISIVAIYLLNERGVISVLRGSTISLICIVILIFATVGSYGIMGLYQNNAGRMLTTTYFDPYAQPDSTSTLNLTVVSDPYDFNLSMPYSVVHIAPVSEREINLTLFNTGALNDSYNITAPHIDGVGCAIEPSSFGLSAGESSNLTATVTSESTGNFSIGIEVKDEIGKTKNYLIVAVVADQGFDFNENVLYLDVRNTESSQISIPISIMNTGIENGTFRIAVTSPSQFIPSLDLPGWNYADNSVTVDLSAGEARNCTLLPRMTSQVNGQFQINLTAVSMDNKSVGASLTVTLNVVNNQYVFSQSPGPIPLSFGHNTTWNVVAYRQGVNSMVFRLPFVPSGVNVTSFLNGTISDQIHDGSIVSLDNGSALITLNLRLTGQPFENGSFMEVQLITPGSELQFGILGLMVGTAILTVFALVIAIPLAIGSSIFLAFYCPGKARRVIKPTMEMIAGIPSVIFGLWGALTFGPFLSNTLYPVINSTLGRFIPFFSGNTNASNSIITASIVLAIMIFPIVMTLSFEALVAVPSELVEGSRALGVTKWQSIRTVILRKAKSGILGSIILGTGRAIGETMAVLMILGFATSIPSSAFGTTGTMTSSIAATLMSVFSDDQARNGIFAIALLLLVFVLILDALLIFVTKEKQGSRGRALRERWPFRFVRWPHWIARRTSIKNPENESRSLSYSFKPSSSLRRSDWTATAGVYAAAAIMLAIVAFIIADIILRGGIAFKLSYLTETQLSGDGFLNAITGSLMLVGLALAVSAPIAVLAAIYVNEFSPKSGRLSKITYLAVSTLSSIPSIVFGAFGFILFILILDFGFSLLAGGLTLAFMILPLIYISTIEGLKTVPDTYREASLALGTSKWKTVSGVVIPMSIPSITSGIFLAIGRAIGETAAILLTAGFAMFVTTSITQPVASMPNLIYNLFDTSAGSPVLMQKVYAAAFLLIVIVVMLNLLGKMISAHYGSRFGVR